jgi:hypothetical protein
VEQPALGALAQQEQDAEADQHHRGLDEREWPERRDDQEHGADRG